MDARAVGDASKGAGTPASVQETVGSCSGQSQQRQVKPFAFGTGSTATSTALPALDRMNEKLARRLRTNFETLSRTKVKLTVQSTKTRLYEDWQEDQPDYCSLSIFSFLSPTTLAMLSVEPSLIMRLVDARYGGTGTSVRPGPREFTSAEEHFTNKLIEGVAAALNDNWNDVVPVNFQLKSRETNHAFANIARHGEQIAIVSFDVEFAGIASAPIQIIYPLASLRQVERELALGPREETADTDYIWRTRLRTALGEVRTSTRTVLARPEMRMGELMRLKVGDIIPVSIPAHVPLIVGDRQLALGIVGDHNGIAAIRIERIAN